MNNTIRAMFFLAFSVIMFIVTPVVLVGQSKLLKTDALTKEADIIVVGKVGRITSEWTNNRSRIESKVTLSVEQTIKGKTTDNSLTIVIPGGEVDGVGEWYSHSARFTRDEDVVLFVKEDQNGRYRVAGGENGKVSIMKESRTGARIIPNVGTLQNFTSKIKDLIKSADNESIRH